MFSEDFSKAAVLDWLKNNQNIYSLKDKELVKEIAKLKPEDELSEELFELQTKGEGPWNFEFSDIDISIPDSSCQPSTGYANVCKSSEYRNKKVEIRSLNSDDKIEVFCSGYYSCDPKFKTPDLQLNRRDAKKIFDNNRIFDASQDKTLTENKKKQQQSDSTVSSGMRRRKRE